MKTTSVRGFVGVVVVALLAMAVFYSSRASAEEAAADPVVGQWAWYTGRAVTVNADGTAQGGKAHGTWKYVGNSSPRKYEFNWDGHYIDVLYLVKNGALLEGKDKLGKKISAARSK